jgi:hypothetical protein
MLTRRIHEERGGVVVMEAVRDQMVYCALGVLVGCEPASDDGLHCVLLARLRNSLLPEAFKL